MNRDRAHFENMNEDQESHKLHIIICCLVSHCWAKRGSNAKPRAAPQIGGAASSDWYSCIGLTANGVIVRPKAFTEQLHLEDTRLAFLLSTH